MNRFIEKKIDKIRKFRLSLLAQKRIEDHFNCSFAKIDHENTRINDFAFMLWAILEQKDREELSPESFMEILDQHLRLEEVYKLFAEITEQAFGKNFIAPPVQQAIPEQEEMEQENGIGMEPYKTL
jgi:hypothetical protein